MDYDDQNLFAKMLRGEIPCDKVYEDDRCMAFRDIAPQAPQHLLMVPKADIPQLLDADEGHAELLGHMMVKVGDVAREQGLGDFRVVINNGPGAQQTVFHLHLHVLAGRDFTWPPG